MNVLSLFDGMSCGQIALNKLDIPVTKYYAAEIDKYAMQIAKKNYPDTIHLGDVRDVNGYDLGDIDLLIGGSPCQGFSFAGKQLNFDDPRSKLFFEFVRLLDECKPTYFMLENVKMKKESAAVITEYLGVEPIEINSNLVSAQNRKRLYWTNIPFEGMPEDKGILLKDILEQTPEEFTLMSDKFTKRNADTGCLIDSTKPKASNLSAMEYVKNGRQGDYLECNQDGVPTQCNQVGLASSIKGHDILRRIYSPNGKAPTLNTMGGGNREPKVAVSNRHWRKLTPTECERLQTVPDGYTEGVSNTQRYKMLGNGWTVDVIAHILKPLQNNGELQ
jgi:DNA (cytosine-5)-methyltransferase 3A